MTSMTETTLKMITSALGALTFITIFSAMSVAPQSSVNNEYQISASQAGNINSQFQAKALSGFEE